MTLTVYLRHAVKKITAKKTEIIDQPRFHADTHSTSQKCPLISSLTPLFDSTNYLALFRSYQRAIIHFQTFSVARGERNAHFSVLAPRLRVWQPRLEIRAKTVKARVKLVPRVFSLSNMAAADRPFRSFCIC